MLLPGTQIHIFVFIILLLELIVFFFQIIYYLSRPSDKSRLWFLFLLLLLIFYNSVSGFLPDKNIPISIMIQNTLAYSGGVLMSMYFPFYFYKVYHLQKLKFYAYWGSILFLLVPFVFFFVFPYYLTNNLNLSRQIVVVVPFIYALSFLYSLYTSIKAERQHKTDFLNNKELLLMYIGVICWVSLPIVVFFDGSQLLENSLANSGLLLMMGLFIYKTIQKSKQEYAIFLESQKEIQQLNLGLSIKRQINSERIDNSNEQINTKSGGYEFSKDKLDQWKFTNREVQIINLIAKGYTNKIIAEQLFISDKTVAKHVENIFKKADVSNRTELVNKLQI
jgi:DNA-binding CsgD family transcriptional regulator